MKNLSVIASAARQSVKTFCSNIYWYFYKLTPKGKRAYILKQGFAGFEKAKKEQNITKWGIIGQANKLLKPKKILAFHKGKSISKPQKSNHQVINQVAKKNKEALNQNHLEITKNGKFKPV